jgi:hypothetical protein
MQTVIYFPTVAAATSASCFLRIHHVKHSFIGTAHIILAETDRAIAEAIITRYAA